jgi:Methyltransferase domain
MVESIRSLYPYALAEGEGVGTAYEYVAKARFMRPIVERLVRRDGARRVLVAGLPEKYGTSLDFAILADGVDADLEIADEREPAIDRSRSAIDAARRDGKLTRLRVQFRRCDSLDEVARGQHDAVLSCEVLQRVPAERREAFANALRAAAPIGAVFVPNSENASHLKISGLDGLTLADLRELFRGARAAYVDMPPFPPGIARTAEQRTRASTGLAEAVAMRVLDAYCAAEPRVPSAIKRRVSHIVCALWGG